MNVWILILAVSSLVVSSQTCPPRHFSAAFVASIDQTFEDANIHIEDTELYFFRKVLHLQEDEIYNVFEDAINFFNYTFGLDFSHSPPNREYQRYLENAKMHAVVTHKDINYIATSNSWIRNGNTRSKCYRIYEGAIVVSLLNYTLLHGRYGGDEGKPAGPGPYDPLVYGFYSIDACEQSPVLIHYRCPTPLRTEPIDATNVVNCYAFNRALGRGNVQGIGTIRPDRNDREQYRIRYTNVITFRPGGERDGQGQREGPGEQDDPGEREGPGDMERPRMRE